MKTTFNLALVLALAATLGVQQADAQGNSRGRGNDRDRHEQRDDRRDDDDDDRPRFERRRTDDRRDDGRHAPSRTVQQRRVPPGWCQGRGNPHNTAENCRYNSQRSRWERYDSRTGRYETYDTYGRSRTGSGSSYDQAHRDFHYAHDRRCRDRAAQRPLDVRYQVQVRSECKAAHDEFHRRWGTAHR